MTPFSFARAEDAAVALQLGATPGAKYLGGGTNLVDLMRQPVRMGYSGIWKGKDQVVPPDR